MAGAVLDAKFTLEASFCTTRAVVDIARGVRTTRSYHVPCSYTPRPYICRVRAGSHVLGQHELRLWLRGQRLQLPHLRENASDDKYHDDGANATTPYRADGPHQRRQETGLERA